jgi:hypothetical protein
MDLCHNFIFNDTVSIIVQVTFVFCFLVIFYFLYVTKVEQDEFKKQIELIVDNLTKDIKEQLNDIIINNGKDKLSQEDFQLLLYGIIDTVEEKVSIDSKKMIEDINESNRKLKNNVYTILLIILAIIGIILIYFNCLPISLIIKEALIVVLFIGITELIFLTFVSERYISADPNRIKNKLGTSIKNWIKNNTNK